MNLITQIENGAYQTEYRGTAYHAQLIAGRWCVLTTRLALGRRHVGGSKWFDTLEQVSQHVKAFAGLATLAQITEVLQ